MRPLKTLSNIKYAPFDINLKIYPLNIQREYQLWGQSNAKFRFEE
jgi:hypothetical protein